MVLYVNILHNTFENLIEGRKRGGTVGLTDLQGVPRSDDCGDRLEPLLPHVLNIGGFGSRDREPIADIAMSAVGCRPDVAQRWS